ncbi:MAG: DEAD/DEAH box helicase [Acidobacteriota bacterium]|nr:DEAD/DEAH box helicase [Acidobacteriota bacterium]MDH3527988.1 DEAD/DEAH box helicase [Acidobacteriota bacterium]
MARGKRKKGHPGGPYKGGQRRSGDSQPYERKSERFIAEKSSEYEDDLRRLLEGIGTPEPSPFVPDPFQVEALEAIELEDVLVTAPTGSGKTWIAREEIRRLLESGRKTWYTTPLKALTNSKYMEFGEEFGEESVGILTGDRKENPGAPLIVGTTEIYRNQLFDALRGGEEVDTDFVILDEAHYLSDDYRGHVWEEAIILSPPRIRLLMLSATIGNAAEFAEWVEETRGTTVRVIDRGGDRPVELRAAFLAPTLDLYPLLDKNGEYNKTLNRFAQKKSGYQDFRRRRKRKY